MLEISCLVLLVLGIWGVESGGVGCGGVLFGVAEIILYSNEYDCLRCSTFQSYRFLDMSLAFCERNICLNMTNMLPKSVSLSMVVSKDNFLMFSFGKLSIRSCLFCTMNFNAC